MEGENPIRFFEGYVDPARALKVLRSYVPNLERVDSSLVWGIVTNHRTSQDLDLHLDELFAREGIYSPSQSHPTPLASSERMRISRSDRILANKRNDEEMTSGQKAAYRILEDGPQYAGQER